MHGRLLTRGGLAALGLTLVLCGCSAAHYKASADREVYSIIGQKSSLVPGMHKDFTIDPSPDSLDRACPPADKAQAADPSAAGKDAARTAATKDSAAPADGTAVVPKVETGAPPAPKNGQSAQAQPKPQVLSLARALEIASANSRSYQTQKENVYLSALTLTSQRYAYDPQPFGRASGSYVDTGMGDTNTVSGNSALGFNWLLRTGASISAQLSTDFSYLISGRPATAASSLFSATITQPLLKGAGLAAEEPLIQAERNVVYQIRSFVQYRRQFFVQVLSQYYGVLENQQLIDNQEQNYNNLDFAYKQSLALSKAGVTPPYQVDQARQQLFSAQDSLLRAKQNYQGSLDNFRILLGLPPEANIVLDRSELTRLTQQSKKNEALQFNEGQAVKVALKQRLDLLTANDQVTDAEREVKVAANGLLTGLSVNAGVSSSTAGPSNPANFTTDNTSLSAGFELDLPLSRLNERNTYRRSLITLQQNKRNQCNVRDNVVESVRNTWRELERTKSSYGIAEASVTLARQRVSGTWLLVRAGRALMTDWLGAQSSLLSAQNSEVSALVEYEVARLNMAVNMDILQVSETGQLKENFDEYFRPQSQ